MQIKRENARLFSVLFTDSEIDFIQNVMPFDDYHICCWLLSVISSRLEDLGYSKHRKEKVNELEG